MVGVAPLEPAVDCSESETGQIYRALVAAQRLLDGSVLQDTELRASRILVSAIEVLCIQIGPTLVCSFGAPKLSSIRVSPVKGSEGSRGEDGISDGVVYMTIRVDNSRCSWALRSSLFISAFPPRLV